MDRVLRSSLILVTSGLVGRSDAQTLRLNVPLPHDPGAYGGDVSFLELAGDRVVFTAEAEHPDRPRLFSSALDGSEEPAELMAPEHSFAIGHLVSPDGTTVAFGAYDIGGAASLYSIPASGGAPVRLHSPFAPGVSLTTPFARPNPPYQRITDTHVLADVSAEALDFELWIFALDASEPARVLHDPSWQSSTRASFTPDGSSVLFLAKPPGSFVQLYRAPTDGSAAPTRLNGDLVSDVYQEFLVGPQHVVYLARQTGDSALSTYAVAHDGSGPPIRLWDRVWASVQDSRVSLDGNWYAFLNGTSIHGVPLDGSLPAGPLTPPSLSNRQPVFEFTPGSTHLVFRMDLDVSNRLELYRVPRDGSSSPVKLSPPLAVNGNVGAFTLSPDGLRVLYLAAVDALPGDELFSVPLAGGTPVQISSVGQSVGTIGNELACRISPDGALLVFTADRQLYLAPTNGSAAPIQLTPTNGPLVDASHGLVLSDSWVACVAEETPLVSELFSAPFDGSQALAKLSPSLHPGPIQRDVRAFRVLPDGSRALYLVNDDPAVLDDLSLYTVTLTGSPVSTRIHSPVRLDRFSLSDPRGFEITPDGACVVFVEPDATTGFEQLFVARTDGSEVPMLLHAGQVDGYEITPDGMSVLFDSAPDNYIVPLDGSAGALAFGPGVEDVFQASPDGQWIVWLRNFQEIWSRRADGSSSALKISGTMPSFGSILRTNEGDYFRVSSDGTRVVYLSDALVDGRAELFVATIDGSSPPVRLNAPLPTGGSVAGDYRISPDSTGVAYRADQETLDRVELFLTPFGGTSTKLSGTTVPGGDVAAQFRFSADGSKVVFVADRLTNAVHELFATPVDASTAPVKISGSMATGGGVVTSFYHAFFQIEADGEHAVYAADQVRDGVVELFRAPLSGTGPSRRLHQGFGSQADLLLDLGLTAHLPPAFFLTGTGHVLFIADANRDESFELFRVPLDGPAFAERRNGSLVPSGDVVISDLSPDPPFHFPVETPTGTVYLADQQADEVFELFLTLRSPTPTTSTGPSITGTVVRQL